MVKKKVTIKVEKQAVAFIDGNQCTNCGKCEDYCPIQAISEKQKEICHMCPDCTEIKAITVDEIQAMQREACTLACPLGISPQGYIALFKAGKEREAFDCIWDKNPLPAVCGYICHHPCETACKRGKLVDRPMEIRALKRFLGEKFLDYQPMPYPLIHEERIAVIGAGPAGLTAAHWLAKKGYDVTVFEESGEAGGMLLRGIPAFRLDKDVVRKEIARLEEAGLKIERNVKAGKEPSFTALLEQFDRVIVASGTQVSKKLPIDGWRTEQVLYAVNLMEKVNSGQTVKLHGNVVVVGGGSVAVDTARTAKRLGAEKVTMICLEGCDTIPAHPWELAEAQEEGIDVLMDVSPQRFLGHTARLEGVEVVKIKNLDFSCGLAFDCIKGTEQVLPADFCIVAVGQASNLDIPDDPRILKAGDVASGKCSVIDAMASGREAAIKIDNELRGREYVEYQVERTVDAGDRSYKVYPAVRRKLQFAALTRKDVALRAGNFDLVETGLTTEDALLETYRCLECGYKFVDPDKCIGCGVCLKICPKGDVITMKAVPQEVK